LERCAWIALQGEETLLRAYENLGHRSYPPEIAGRTCTRSDASTRVSSRPCSPLTKMLMCSRMSPCSSRIQPSTAGWIDSSARSSSTTVAPSSACVRPPHISESGARRITLAIASFSPHHTRYDSGHVRFSSVRRRKGRREIDTEDGPYASSSTPCGEP